MVSYNGDEPIPWQKQAASHLFQAHLSNKACFKNYVGHSISSISSENVLLYVIQNIYNEKRVKCGSLIYKIRKDIKELRRKTRKI